MPSIPGSPGCPKRTAHGIRATEWKQNEATGYDNKNNATGRHTGLGVPVLFLKHPSRPLSKKEEPDILGALREEIKYFINRANQ